MFGLGINYNNEPQIFRKGSVLYRDVCISLITQHSGIRRSDADQSQLMDSFVATTVVAEGSMSRTQKEKEGKKRQKAIITLKHTDIIQDDFWKEKSWLGSSAL